MTRVAQALGAFGERVAERHLVDAGMTILARNWRCRDGEIDLIARDGDCVVFCEVKTRSSDRFGTPLEAITPQKAARIRRLAARWLSEEPGRRGRVRFDAVEVRRQRPSGVQVTHTRAVF
jgi:putative endonuclease